MIKIPVSDYLYRRIQKELNNNITSYKTYSRNQPLPDSYESVEKYIVNKLNNLYPANRTWISNTTIHGYPGVIPDISRITVGELAGICGYHSNGNHTRWYMDGYTGKTLGWVNRVSHGTLWRHLRKDIKEGFDLDKETK